jgi:hypothetical protein
MHKLRVHYYKPQQVGVDMSEDSSDNIHTYITTMTQSNLKRGKKNLPIMPRLHAEALLHLTRLCINDRNYLVLPLATYIALHLTKENPSEVKLRIQDIAQDLNMSDKSITKNIKLLEELGYLKTLSQSNYYISPKLAYYGSGIRWSLALQCEEEGMSKEETEKLTEQVDIELSSMEIKHLHTLKAVTA